MSPEVAVGTEMRKVLAEPHIKQTLMLIAVDKAHCIPEWLVYSALRMYANVLSIHCVGVWTSENVLSGLVSCVHWWMFHS